MSWYADGTVTVANGSTVVTGAGTDFVANAAVGHAFLGPDGKIYEIAQIVSATQMNLRGPYLGGSGGGQGYAVMPTQSFIRDLALGAAQLLNTFADLRDTVGQGLFGDGSLAAPGMRFTADQDTGFTRFGANQLCLVAGGVAGCYVNATRVLLPGHLDVGVGKFVAANVADTFSSGGTQLAHYGLTMKAGLFGADVGTAISGYYGVALFTIGTERARIDNFGNFLLGTTTGAEHRICKNVPQGSIVAIIRSTASDPSIHSAAVCAVSGYTPNGATAALYLGHSTQTNRSLNASGTLNASGADYAEYMRKAAGCGTIAKGDVCGVDRDGHLTKMWADAISFVVKSTDPSYVGGDTWGLSCGPRPEGPGEEPVAPRVPPAAPASGYDADVAAATYAAQLAAYQAAHDTWLSAKAAYDTALPAWEAALEVERQKVDRIAFSGQVPVNVSGDFAVGDYLIAAPSGAGIKAVAVPADTITFDQYRRRLGKVWAVRDGRAWVDVQHG